MPALKGNNFGESRFSVPCMHRWSKDLAIEQATGAHHHKNASQYRQLQSKIVIPHSKPVIIT